MTDHGLSLKKEWNLPPELPYSNLNGISTFDSTDSGTFFKLSAGTPTVGELQVGHSRRFS